EGPPAAGRSGVYDRFRNRLIVPLVAPGGAIVGFGARALAEDDPPKYLNSPETPVYHKGSFLYALDVARKRVGPEGELIVVEGYFDAITLHQAGLGHTVATSGTALTPDQARLVRRVARGVALTYDGDAAGQDAMMRSLGVLLAEGLEVAVVELPSGTDPDSLVRTRGIEGWSEARARAGDAVGFIQRHVVRAAGAAGPAQARERALHAVVGLAAGVGDEIRRRLLLERASRIFGFEEAVLARAVALKRRGEHSDAPLEASTRARRDAARSLERQALQALLMAPAEIPYAKGEIDPTDFEDPACAALARYLWEGEGNTPASEPAATLARELEADAPESAAWGVDARIKTLQLAMRSLASELREVQERQARAAAGPEAEALARRAEGIVSRRLVREEMCRRLQTQGHEPRAASDPDHILSEIEQIHRRATGRSDG
ncbi:MAG TPA: toprim domain-containing protein, partial [Candidatus Eisenbacteria bacterium]